MPQPATRTTAWGVGVPVGMLVSTVSIAHIVSIQHTKKQYVEHVLETNDSTTTCGYRHNRLPGKAVPIALLWNKLILAQVL